MRGNLDRSAVELVGQAAVANGDFVVPRAVDFDAEPGWMRVRPYIGEYADPEPDDEPDDDLDDDVDDDLDDDLDDEPEPTEADTAAYPLVPQPRQGVTPARAPTPVAPRGRRSDYHGPPVGRHILRRRGGGRSPVLLAAGGVAVFLVVAAGVVLATTGGHWGGPGAATLGATGTGGGSRSGGASVADGTSRPSDQSRPGDPSGTAGTAQSANPATLGAPPSAAGTTGNAGTPPGATQSQTDPANQSPGPLPPTWSPPPAVDVTGPITNVAGLCLASSDDRARLWSCDGTASQTWTLAVDGTLRLGTQCLQPGAGLVRLRACDGSAAQQWRVGPAGSLVNPAAPGCLGDPESGANKGTPERTAPCDQSDAQRWTLPGTGA